MSLLNDVDTIAPSEALEVAAKEESSQVAQETPSWYWDSNTPGTGERPDFLPEKFKTVADMAKAQKELEKKLGTAPEKYDFSKGKSWIEEDYEPFQHMADFAKKNHVPQEVMDKFLDTVGLYLDEFTLDINEEKAKLGENANERIKVLNNWAKSNLSEKSFEVLSGAFRTAESIEALEELRSKMIGSSSIIPNGNESVSPTSLTIEEYRAELNSNYEKFKSDPSYRKDMERKLKSIVKE